jgi:hypothetical protein
MESDDIAFAALSGPAPGLGILIARPPTMSNEMLGAFGSSA